MSNLSHVFDQNKEWAQGVAAQDKQFFERLAAGQSPKILWIGCADSRVPPARVCGLSPGEVFVHRNVANLVVHTDLNCLSVVQYAVEVLKVSDVVICGHYGCGGVQAALGDQSHGLIDNWLRNIKDTAFERRQELQSLEGQAKKDRMCELNVERQVKNLCHTSIVQDAWKRGQQLAVHGWIFRLSDGSLRDLELTVEGADKMPEPFKLA